jgi:predicted metal-dependent phosphoesterase TrpH
MDPFAMLTRAREVGLDGVVITEHDWLWTEAELDELRAAADGLLVLAGIEVSTHEGHFLAYGVRNPFSVPKGIHVAELCREVHYQGGAVVAAHPFRWGQPFEQIMKEEQPEIDGLEMMSKNMDTDCRKQAARAMQVFGPRLGLAELGNSDAHSTDMLGVCYTTFHRPLRDARDLVEAIRSRQTSAHDRLAEEAR